MNKLVLCPSCKGKGHVYEAMTLLIPFWGWILAPFERNNPNGVTRMRCEQCGGTGYIKPSSR
ncbi:MAG: hypothetical protein Q8R29_03055 [bacterium]|nr:hypothetical protein [bacterium]